ncbi:hypothetical protein POTOM_040072 [Populus tomentosa]|uniref:25S rRNA (uridine-N(3))-methyltransferase BMT5-like domain-containing protein n=1 Tax=Populus tomentosa TaxID=118781 RepID=A0A8X8CJY8_POPTO|nr:hypothetical protein POTOM_040072 [Populus tomentosa]
MLGPRPKLNRHCMHMDYGAIKLEPFTVPCMPLVLPLTSLSLISTRSEVLSLEVVKRLVKGFLKSAHDTLEENEEIHVIHKTTYPYKKWEIEKSAEDAELFLVKKVNFRVSDYPGYENKIG